MDNSTQYWLNQNNVQSGPMSAEELKGANLTANDYVWRSGLTDWVKITELPEFATLGITFGAEPLPPITPIINPEPAPIVPENSPEGVDEPDSAPVDAMPDTPKASGDQTEQPAQIVPELPIITGSEVAAAQQPAQQPYQPQQAYQTQQPAAAEYPKCPPTNMVWAVLATILCCIPLGIIAIVYSNKVSKAYYSGDFERAEHYSEVSAWWCIGTIIGGIVLSPFVSLLQLAFMN